jgi:hypothetical protein
MRAGPPPIQARAGRRSLLPQLVFGVACDARGKGSRCGGSSGLLYVLGQVFSGLALEVLEMVEDVFVLEVGTGGVRSVVACRCQNGDGVLDDVCLAPCVRSRRKRALGSGC